VADQEADRLRLCIYPHQQIGHRTYPAALEDRFPIGEELPVVQVEPVHIGTGRCRNLQAIRAFDIFGGNKVLTILKKCCII